MERRSIKEPVITLIIMIIIAAVIISWLTGLWSCDNGRKNLNEQKKLSIADYVNSASVLIQHSNKTSVDFFILLSQIKDISREELDKNLSDITEESRISLQSCLEMNPPASFEVAQGYLKLVLDLRTKAYENFKPALFNALQNIQGDIASSQITNAFLNMHMSDEVYKYFQDEIKASGEKLEITNLTILNSRILKDNNLIDPQNVAKFISDIKTVANLQERRGLALINNSIEFNPKIINEQGDYLILAKGNEIAVTMIVENQGNVAEKDVVVVMKYITENNPKAEEKTYTITSINPSEQKSVTISGFKAFPGIKCNITIEVKPVQGESLITNNTASFKFMVEK
ncbi:MAG: hypothetical protein M1475_01240 [Actinobacteria bacterium]|nr:hypothetical protein [Actinomycetota bacterium]MCL6087011.1 hypothetical protein [Actinomycetota bacterium]